jgi:hypothetical protein
MGDLRAICLLRSQFLSMSKFLADLVRFLEKLRNTAVNTSLGHHYLYFTKSRTRIHLESAAFMFHMGVKTLESSGRCEPRVLIPSNGFLACPSS